jgi:histidinol-phosphatase (PHP family)
MRVDLHNHTILCKHATGSMEEYIKKAISLGINDYGFSCHAPMEFDKKYRMSISEMDLYESKILELKQKYKNKINILLAYEVDYMSEVKINKKVLNSKCDYLIGSVHFLDKWGFDNPEYLGEYKKRDINEIIIKYYEKIEQMANTKLFNIVGHIDLIKLFGFKPTNNMKIKDLTINALQAIKNANMSIEINTAGLKKQCKEIYPSKEILNLAYNIGIDITFSSDAHKIDDIGFGYDKAISLAKSVGYDSFATYRQKEKIMVRF